MKEVKLLELINEGDDKYIGIKLGGIALLVADHNSAYSITLFIHTP